MLERLGPPAKRLSNAEYRCLVYATDAGVDTWLRMCFRNGKMTGLGTIPGRATAFTLNVPEVEGSGKVRRPKVFKKPRHVEPRRLKPSK